MLVMLWENRCIRKGYRPSFASYMPPSGENRESLPASDFCKGHPTKSSRSFRPGQKDKLSPADFLKRYAPLAMSQQRKYGIPSSVILAQMAFESGWGTSKLAKEGNNFFGIKASKSWLEKDYPIVCIMMISQVRNSVTSLLQKKAWNIIPGF